MGIRTFFVPAGELPAKVGVRKIEAARGPSSPPAVSSCQSRTFAIYSSSPPAAITLPAVTGPLEPKSMFGNTDRRHFMKHMAAGAAVTVPGLSFLTNLRARAAELKKKQKSLIILWMGGGPSTIDLW